MLGTGLVIALSACARTHPASLDELALGITGSTDYTYFDINGHTAAELAADIRIHAPKDKGSIAVGEIRTTFQSQWRAISDGTMCSMTSVHLTMHSEITLPRWSAPPNAAPGLRGPRWWAGWWPSGWRRPGDVSDRLPAPLRRLRNVATVSSIFVLMVFGYVPTFIKNTVSPDLWVPNPITVGVLFVSVVTVGWWGLHSIFAAERWALAQGLTKAEVLRLGRAKTIDVDFWRKPKFAALLLAPTDARLAVRAAADPRTPDDFLSAIVDLAAQLSGPVHHIVIDAVGAARRVVASIEALDAEIATLARDADPAERALVEQRCRALGGPVEGELESREQMRALLHGQLDLLLRLAAQLNAASDRRAGLVDLLKTVWLHVATLRADAVAEAVHARDLSDEIRALCQEIERHVAGAAGVRQLMA